MKSKLFFILISFITIESHAQINRFRNIIGDTSAFNQTSNLDSTFDGGFILGGDRYDGAVLSSYVIKTDSHGRPEWSKEYFYSNRNFISKIIQTVDSGYILTGSAYNTSQWYDMQLVKLDKNGNIQWSFTYSNRVDPIPLGCGGTDIIEMPNCYYITGGFYRTNNSQGAMILRVDLNGNLLNSNLIFTPSGGPFGVNGTSDIFVLPNGDFATAFSWDGRKVLVYTFDVNCNILSHFTIIDPYSNQIDPISIQLNSNGNFNLLCRNEDTTGTPNLLFLEIAASGAIISSYRYDIPGYNMMEVQGSIDNVGALLVTGSVRATSTNTDRFIAIRFTAPGATTEQTIFQDRFSVSGQSIQLQDGSYAVASTYYDTFAISGITKLDRRLQTACGAEDFSMTVVPYNLTSGPGGLVSTETITRYQLNAMAVNIPMIEIVICSDSISDAPLNPFPDHTIYFPNAFSPSNEDGLNDEFLPVCAESVNGYHLLIFNRWGQLLFESNSSSQGWNGSYKGDRCVNGVYVWKVDFIIGGEKKEMIGHVTLL